jgi:hypothetical protein
MRWDGKSWKRREDVSSDCRCYEAVPLHAETAPSLFSGVRNTYKLPIFKMVEAGELKAVRFSRRCATQ